MEGPEGTGFGVERFGFKCLCDLGHCPSEFNNGVTWSCYLLDKAVLCSSDMGCDFKSQNTVQAWWAAIHGVSQSRTRLKWLSSRSYSLVCNDQSTDSMWFRVICLYAHLSTAWELLEAGLCLTHLLIFEPPSPANRYTTSDHYTKTYSHVSCDRLRTNILIHLSLPAS